MTTPNTNQSETPRTDAIVGQREYGSLADSEYVRLARTLEKELNEANYRVELHKGVIDELHTLMNDKVKQLTTAIAIAKGCGESLQCVDNDFKSTILRCSGPLHSKVKSSLTKLNNFLKEVGNE